MKRKNTWMLAIAAVGFWYWKKKKAEAQAAVVAQAALQKAQQTGNG